MPERIELVDLGRMHRELRAELAEALRRVCANSTFVGGPEVAAFEQEWAQFTGAQHVVGVANGTDAIQLVLNAARLPDRSEIAVPANTFIATAEGVLAAGHRVRFLDVEEETGLIDLDELDRALDDGVSGVIVVHLYGRMADMDAVMALASRRGALVIEDAAQAHDAWRTGRHAGTVGHAGTFSFYPGKNLGALGDAGAVVTNDEQLAGEVRLLRDHGRQGRDNHVVVGVNSRLDGLQAAVLRAKLPFLKDWTAARRTVAQTYRREFPADLLDWPGNGDVEAESHHLFPILSPRRDRLAEALRSQGIATGVHYRVPCPCTPAFGSQRGRFRVAEKRADNQLSLPIHPYLSAAEVAHIVSAVSDSLTKVSA